ncbi:penicillin-binding protein 2 [Kiritimatiellota bacterium B12222]|nr:penicillin-binding protein 2 [Kiritimatiellota bacterium B12222]
MPPNPSLDFLQQIFSDAAWPLVASGLRWLFLLGLLWSLFRYQWDTSSNRSRVSLPRLSSFWTFLILLCFGGIAFRQAQWQLMGRHHEAFVSFMQRYDRREFNPAHRIRAGKILDHNNRILVESRVSEKGVTKRFHRYGPTFGHVLGYNDPVYGLTGVESAAQRSLLGQKLESKQDWKALGAEVLDRERFAEGPAVYTSLDLGLQRRASELLGDQKGAVVVMEIKTGEIRALVSHPDYDPNRLYNGLFSGKVPDAPLMNRAITGHYPPGSVFKVLIAASALQNGFKGTYAAPPEGYTNSPANPPIRDHEYYAAKEKGQTWRGYGPMSLSTALAKSSNVFFAQLGVDTGAASLLRTTQAAGLAREFYLWPGSEPTLRVKAADIPDLTDKNPYEIAQFSIGQGDLLVSPLQVAMICAAVANQGVVVKPTLERNAVVQPLGRLCGPQQADQLKWMMYKVVQEGTGRGMKMAELPVAAKTGTAQTGGHQLSHSWFAGFAPVSEPRWAFCVLVEHGGYGSAAALPIARDLMRDALQEGWLKL